MCLQSFHTAFQWLVLPLISNRVEHNYEYEVYVYTGLKKGAETQSNVRFMLSGTDGATQVHDLADGQRKVNHLDLAPFCVLVYLPLL